jgi:hypothetical protein
LATSLLIFGSFGATLVATEPRFRTRGWIFAVGLVLIVVAASTSTTGYFGLAVLLMLLGRRRPWLALGLGAGASLVGAVLLLSLPDFASVIYDVTLGKASTGSYTERTTSVANALDGLSQLQWWIGTGWGGVISYSLLTVVFTSTGLIGSICFASAVLATLAALRLALRADAAADWRLHAYSHGLENAMVVYLAMSVVSGFRFVVADFWCLWAIAIALPSAMLQCVHPLPQLCRIRPSWGKTLSGSDHDGPHAQVLG